MEGRRKGEIINELALPVTPSYNPGLEAALHWPARSWDNWGLEEEEEEEGDKWLCCMAPTGYSCFC